jgi:hypothetical protein
MDSARLALVVLRQLQSNFQATENLTCLGLSIMHEYLVSQLTLNALFGTGEDAQDCEGSKHCNALWGTNGLIPQILSFWIQMI